MFSTNDSREHLEEGVGILLMTLGLLLGASLLTYSPTDPSLSSLSTQPGVRNAVGRLGAYLADLLFQGFGRASFLFPLFLIGLGIDAMRRSERVFSRRSLLGFLMLILSASALLHLHDATGRGGNLTGSLIGQTLIAGLARTGAHLLLIPLFVLSLTLTFRFSLRAMLGRIFLTFGRLLHLIRSRIQIRQGRRRRVAIRPKNDRPLAVAGPARAHPPPPETLQSNEQPQQEPLGFMKGSGDYLLPITELLTPAPPGSGTIGSEELQRNAQILQKKLSDFEIKGQVTRYHPGPVVTLYEFEPAPGIKVNRIVTLSDDLALAMKALQVRIVAPIPGESAVGIEIPNPAREEVFLRDIMESKEFGLASVQKPLPLALGKDIFGRPMVADLCDMPHLLVAGSTGSGKSVGLNAMILSLLFSSTPDQLKLLLIDPKRLELSQYEGIPHLLRPVVVQPREAAKALRRIVTEMERRYEVLAEHGVRNIRDFNARGTPLPYIVVIIDELADLMMVASREVEEAIGRLAQMARAAGIHLILATQRPSVDVLTGVIKANFPARISFYVSSKTDSRTILDANGAEQLLGKGDSLFLSPGSGRITRIHGSFVGEEDIRRVVKHIKTQGTPDYSAFDGWEAPTPSDVGGEERDGLYQQAVDLVLSTGQASASFLQRRMRVGYPRAARMIEMMEEDGIVGPASGGRPREILLKREGAEDPI